MARPNRLKEIEAEYGEPLDQLIVPLVAKGGQKLAAQKLGVTQATISTWLRRNNYYPIVVWSNQGESTQ